MMRSPGLIVSFLLAITLTNLMGVPIFVMGQTTMVGSEPDDLPVENLGHQPPTATIVNVSRYQVNVTDSVVMQGLGADGDSFVIGYSWWSDIDGNLSRALGEVIFDDLTVGAHVISFAVVDDQGVWSQPDHVNLTVMPPPAPVVTDIRHNPNSLGTGQSVRFYAYATSSDQKVVRYKWDLEGDGIWDRVTTTGNLVHHYSSPGHYNPTVMVMAEDGQWSQSYNIHVHVTGNTYQRDTEAQDDELLGGLCLLILIFVVPLCTYKWGVKRQLKRCKDRDHYQDHNPVPKVRSDPLRAMNEALALERAEPAKALTRYQDAKKERSSMGAWMAVAFIVMLYSMAASSDFFLFFLGLILIPIVLLLAIEDPTRKSARELAPLGMARCYLRLNKPKRALRCLDRATLGYGLRYQSPHYLTHIFHALRSLAQGELKASRQALDLAYRLPTPRGAAFYYLSLGLTQSMLEWRMRGSGSPRTDPSRKAAQARQKAIPRQRPKIDLMADLPERDDDEKEERLYRPRKETAPAPSAPLAASNTPSAPQPTLVASPAGPQVAAEPGIEPVVGPGSVPEVGPGTEPVSEPGPQPASLSVAEPVTTRTDSELTVSPVSSKPNIQEVDAVRSGPSAATEGSVPDPGSAALAVSTPKWRSASSGSLRRQSRFEGLTLAPSALMELVEWVMEGLDLQQLTPSVTQVPGHFIGLIRYFAHDREGRSYGVQLEVIGGLQHTRLIMRVHAPDEESLEELHTLVHEELALRLEITAPSVSTPSVPAVGSQVKQVSGDYICGSKTEVRDSAVSRWGVLARS